MPPFTVPSKEDFSDFDKLHREASSPNGDANPVEETVIAEINVDVAQSNGAEPVNLASSPSLCAMFRDSW